MTHSEQITEILNKSNELHGILHSYILNMKVADDVRHPVSETPPHIPLITNGNKSFLDLMKAGAQLLTPEEWLVLMIRQCEGKDVKQYIAYGTWECVGGITNKHAADALSGSDGADLDWDHPSYSSANGRARSALRGTPWQMLGAPEGADLATAYISFTYPTGTLDPDEPITTWLINHAMERGIMMRSAKDRAELWAELRWSTAGDWNLARLVASHGYDIAKTYNVLPPQPTIGDRLGQTITFRTQVAQDMPTDAPVFTIPLT